METFGPKYFKLNIFGMKNCIDMSFSAIDRIIENNIFRSTNIQVILNLIMTVSHDTSTYIPNLKFRTKEN